MRVILLITKP